MPGLAFPCLARVKLTGLEGAITALKGDHTPGLPLLPLDHRSRLLTSFMTLDSRYLYTLRSYTYSHTLCNNYIPNNFTKPKFTSITTFLLSCSLDLSFEHLINDHYPHSSS